MSGRKSFFECDPGAPPLSADAAAARVIDAIEPIAQAERVALRDARERVLAANLLAPRDVPPHDNAAMDGYALRSADISTFTAFTISGVALAGHPYTGTVGPGECVRIMTGAVVPPECDTVIMQEQVEREGESVRLRHAPAKGEHIRRRGEDLRAGEIVLARGRRLGPAELGLVASLGLTEVAVIRLPRVGYFSTGDELRAVGETLSPGEIYDSNVHVIGALLARHRIAAMELDRTGDDREIVRERLLQAAGDADMVITSGGASVGDADHIRSLLQELGQVEFVSVAMRPGRPLAFGKIGQAYFFGLPGNPVSAMVTFMRFVAPALRRLAGEAHKPTPAIVVPCAEALSKTPGRQEYQRGRLESDAQGRLVVYSTGAQGSGVLKSMSLANCFIVLPAECGDVAAGTPVVVQPFDFF